LLDRLGQEALDAQELARRAEVGGVDLARKLDTLRIDRRIGEGDHNLSIGRGTRPLEGWGHGADTRGVQLRARDEEGFGLIELVIALVVLKVGITRVYTL